jgi:glucuronoarabinoxylan endo-1,4-beta-xylanase
LRNNIPWDIEMQNDNNDPKNLDISRFNLKGVLAKQLPYLKAMHNAGLQKLIISSWTPMDWMKIDIPSDVESWCDGQCGGKLNPDLYEEYVEYLVAYIKIIKQQCGIDVYALSPQNEPLFEQRTFESCVYTPEELATLVKLFGQRLQEENIATKIFAPEHMGSYDWERDFFEYLLIKEPATRQFMYAFAVHSYLDGVAPDYGSAEGWQKMYMGAQQYGKQLWMTETSGYQQDWDGAMSLASSIYLALKFGKVSAWVYWQLSESGPSEYALMNGGEPTPLYHISKQFYRFIRPGAVHLESAVNDNNVLPLLFTQASEKSYTIVLINRSNMNKSIYIPGTVANRDFETFRSARTLASSYVRQVYSNGTVYLPAQSITTLYAGPPIPNISPE